MAVRKHDRQAVHCPVDAFLLIVVIVLIAIGIVMVASASSEISNRMYGSPFYLLTKHMAFLAISLVVACSILLVPIRLWHKADWFLLIMSFVLLLAVLIPGIGREVNGSIRWIPLGWFSIQSSEFVKLFVIVYVSGYLVRRKEQLLNQWIGFAKPFVLLSAVVLLLLIEPDFGAVVVITVSVMGLVFLAGVPLHQFLPVITLSSITVSCIAIWEPYRLQRLLAFADPWEHQFSSGYQLTQALIAFGRGEWFGLGLGNSIQKLFFLPEAHTDFLFSILAEELGAVGAIAVIVLFVCLICRALWIGRRASQIGNEFTSLLAYGIALLLTSQIIINIGVNLGLLPTKGLTLPFMSYGGNSLIVCSILVAILLRIDYENSIETERKG
jgi:cell division protein FtsW